MEIPQPRFLEAPTVAEAAQVLGCRLAFAARSARLGCPGHGATFALDGSVLTRKLPVPLAALPSISKPHTSELGHEVQFAGPCVAVIGRNKPNCPSDM